MNHVVLARDRRRKKKWLKGIIFFMALFSIFIGVFLTFKSRQESAIAVPLPHSTSILTGETNASQPVDPLEPNYVELQIPESKVDESATSYDDELTAKDDEVETVEIPEASSDDSLGEGTPPEPVQKQFSYSVAKGDNLRDVLGQSGLSEQTAMLLEKKFTDLSKLKAGQQFHWSLDNEGELEHLNWLVSEREERVYDRQADGNFSQKVIEKKGVWKQDVLKGSLSADFASTLKQLGLSQRQINQLSSAIQWQIAVNRLKKGDKFAILVKREYIDGKVTELGNVDGIHIVSGNKSYYAIQASDGRYYNRNGETLGKGFSRYPLQYRARISSHFNPRRFHPVTRRVAPHKGVDFSVPIGTPIIAPADGVVEHIAYQARGAGRYIKLRHGGQYTTVYMHLSRTLVKVGQSVKKGDRIALSGNTGRSTGPHLHYEFHINGHPVNPMTVKLPGSNAGMPEKERKAFLQTAKAVEAKLKM